MSVAGILSTAAISLGSQLFQTRMQKVKQEFQQLGQDLQSGNLSAAQSDFATLQSMQPQSAPSSSPQGSSVSQDFNQLSTDLKAGNTTAAQQDLTKLQQDLQAQPPTTPHHHHHHDGSSSDSAISQLFSQLGSALKSGNLSAAQQAYSTMLQSFQQYGATGVAASQTGTNALSLSA